MAALIQVRRDTTANWVSQDTVLSNGEIGLDTTVDKFKFGDGTTAWTSLPYYEDDLDVTGVLSTDGLTENQDTITSTSNAITADCSSATVFYHVLTENTTFTFSNPPSSGESTAIAIQIVQDSGGSGYTVTWPSSVNWASGTAPTLTSDANAVDWFVFVAHDGGTNWYGFTAGQDMSVPA